MLLTLAKQHYSEPRGRAYPVTVRHPEAVKYLWAGMNVRLWTGEAWVGRSAKCVEDVVNCGDGLCFVEMREIWLKYPFDCDPGAIGVAHILATIWISLPGDVDPRSLGSELILDLEPESAATGGGTSSGPLLILGAQRSGTTALQVALHLATRYAAPADINRFPGNTLEGFHISRVMQRFARHRFLTCFGADAHDGEPCTGLFDDSAFADSIVESLADHLRRAYSLAACTTATWTDKCPGWEAAAIGPLFGSLFPGAMVVFMTREPIGCVLSITRLESAMPCELSDRDVVGALARNSASWVCAHLIWRRYGRTRLSRRAWAEIPFDAFQDDPQRVMPELAGLLDLTEGEQAGVLAALRRVPLQRHPVDLGTLGGDVPALIWRLCAGEARRWGYSPPADHSIDPHVLEHAYDVFVAHLRHILLRHALRPEVIDQIAARHIATALSPDAPPADEPPVPAPGPLLGARLARLGRLHGESS